MFRLICSFSLCSYCTTSYFVLQGTGCTKVAINFRFILCNMHKRVRFASKKHLLKKAVLSKPLDRTLQKTVLTARLISKKEALQAESFHKDNKAKHKNIRLDEVTLDKDKLKEAVEIATEYLKFV